eukprot:11001970-Ditylum_brightwellii.AAC.1
MLRGVNPSGNSSTSKWEQLHWPGQGGRRWVRIALVSPTNVNVYLYCSPKDKIVQLMEFPYD